MTLSSPPPHETPHAAPRGAPREPSTLPAAPAGFQLRGAVEDVVVSGDAFGNVAVAVEDAIAVVERRRIPALVMLLDLAAGGRVAGPAAFLRAGVVARAAAALRRHGVDDAGRELAQRVTQANARELAAAVASVEAAGEVAP